MGAGLRVFPQVLGVERAVHPPWLHRHHQFHCGRRVWHITVLHAERSQRTLSRRQYRGRSFHAHIGKNHGHPLAQRGRWGACSQTLRMDAQKALGSAQPVDQVDAHRLGHFAAQLRGRLTHDVIGQLVGQQGDSPHQYRHQNEEGSKEPASHAALQKGACRTPAHSIILCHPNKATVVGTDDVIAAGLCRQRGLAGAIGSHAVEVVITVEGVQGLVLALLADLRTIHG